MPHNLPSLSRRTVLAGSCGTLFCGVIPATAVELSSSMKNAILDQFGKIPEIDNSSVKITIPTINENGNSVPVTIDVDTPMTQDNFIKRVSMFSERNPIPGIVDFYLSPNSGIARVSTRVRLAGSQTLMAVAESNNKQLIAGTAETIVTLAACIVM